MNIRPANIDIPEAWQLSKEFVNPDHDEQLWKLTNTVQRLQRSNEAMRQLLSRSIGSATRIARLEPKLGATGTRKSASPTKPWPEDPWWPRSRLPEVSLRPLAGHLCHGLTTVDTEHVGVSVIGLRGADLEAAISQLEASQIASGDFKPVILTDAPDWLPSMRRGYVTEYVTADEVGAGDESRAGLPDAVRAFLERKWSITDYVDMRDVRASSHTTDETVHRPLAAVAPFTEPSRKKRQRAAVVSWDLGHNPAGRAMVLYDLLAQDYDVELVGPLWSRYGGDVWAPIRDSARTVKSFPCEDLTDFWPRALAYSADADYDLIVVCKPRLPSLVLGALLKKTCGCPLVLDIDDFELSYFPDDAAATLEELEQGGVEALIEPYLELATRACEGLIADADARIVSNVALRSRYGGTIVRHARDEHHFDRHRFDRSSERLALGMTEDDFAIMFVGTARAHKGLYQVAETLARLRDRRFVLHLVGDVPDLRVKKTLDDIGARVVYHPGCDFDDLPRHLVAADAVVLMQDPEHPVSQYQIPAKISDAAALGIPILCTDVPPVRDIALQGLLRLVTVESLGSALLDLIDERREHHYGRKLARIREGFEAELGFEVNRRRIGFAATRAGGAEARLPASFERLIEIVGRAYGELRHAREDVPPIPPAPHGKGWKKLARWLRPDPEPFDIVMFWKQNDSGLYGRRPDKLMHHLLASGRVGKVLQFDAPVDLATLASSTAVEPGSPDDLVLRNVVDSQFGLRDSERLMMRTYLWDSRERQSAFPLVGASLADYPDFVAEHMALAGIRPENAVAWVYPVVFDFPSVAARIPFRTIVGDLVDDQRTFPMKLAHRERITSSYVETLPLFDMTLTNCAPMAEAFGKDAAHIHVVPNGTDRPCAGSADIPEFLAALPRPLVGYIGNLRDRIDWDLLEQVSRRLPQMTFAIIGGGARPEDTERLSDCPNVVFTGVVPSDMVPACLRAFDVAIMPHLKTEQTSRMNPLKIYNYFGARRPIVSTPVDNIDVSLRKFIRFAEAPAEFTEAIADACKAPFATGRAYDRALNGILWEKRSDEIAGLIDQLHKAQG